MIRTIFRISIGLVLIAGLLIAHEMLLRRMIEDQTAVKMLSPSGHAPMDDLIITGAFFLVRLIVLILLPAIVLSKIGMMIIDIATRRRKSSS